jgi:hypothetical protein
MRYKAKYLIKEFSYRDESFFCLYKRNWFGKYKLIMNPEINNGQLKTLEDAERALEDLRAEPRIINLHYKE